MKTKASETERISRKSEEEASIIRHKAESE